jgi:hypothetical protein
MNTRNGTLSPVSTDSQEWSPITRYQNIAGDNPYSPTIPPNNYGPPSNPDGGMLNGMRPAGNGNPSPPSSVGRSSDGTTLYNSRMSDASVVSNRKMQLLEETLSEHFKVLKAYLGPYLNDAQGNPRPSRAKDKLTRLSAVQFQELSTDVYDESIRREDDRKRVARRAWQRHAQVPAAQEQLPPETQPGPSEAVDAAPRALPPAGHRRLLRARAAVPALHCRRGAALVEPERQHRQPHQQQRAAQQVRHAEWHGQPPAAGAGLSRAAATGWTAAGAHARAAEPVRAPAAQDLPVEHHRTDQRNARGGRRRQRRRRRRVQS